MTRLGLSGVSVLSNLSCLLSKLQLYLTRNNTRITVTKRSPKGSKIGIKLQRRDARELQLVRASILDNIRGSGEIERPQHHVRPFKRQMKVIINERIYNPAET